VQFFWRHGDPPIRTLGSAAIYKTGFFSIIFEFRPMRRWGYAPMCR
jgi:hypothetical protein